MALRSKQGPEWSSSMDAEYRHVVAPSITDFDDMRPDLWVGKVNPVRLRIDAHLLE